MIGLLLASAYLALAFWPQLLAQAQQARPAESQRVSPYQMWLNRDVVYIIKEEERAAFRRLQTDAERERFIVQFWARRDPTPATPRNEFMEEHYRRIASANARFEAAGMAGWKTDRGRIYITFGPPDELDRHPNGGPYQGTNILFPFETWHYRFVDGVGQDVFIDFIDPSRRGEYQMSLDPSVPGQRLQRPDANAFPTTK